VVKSKSASISVKFTGLHSRYSHKVPYTTLTYRLIKNAIGDLKRN
jgi:hypothetical protein